MFHWDKHNSLKSKQRASRNASSKTSKIAESYRSGLLGGKSKTNKTFNKVIAQNT